MHNRLTRWLVSLPPTLFLLVFFVAPSLIMVVASFRFPGDYGGLAPLVEDGHLAAHAGDLTVFFSDFIYPEIFIKVLRRGARHHADLHPPGLRPWRWLITRSPKQYLRT